MDIQVSLVASAVRTKVWPEFYASLRENKINWEIVFVGNRKPEFPLPENFRWIYANVKPAQCYEIGFRAARGETLHWTADDANYIKAPNRNGLDRAYQTYAAAKDYKTIIAMRPYEDGSANVWKFHHFFGGKENTPIMAPFGVMSRQFLRELGGYDKGFIGGQSENDVVMSAFEHGGHVEIDLEAHLWVNHGGVHEHPNKFRAYYKWDREVLENAWVPTGYGSYNDRSLNWDQVQISKTRLRPVDPFIEQDDWTLVSQGPKGENMPWN